MNNSHKMANRSTHTTTISFSGASAENCFDLQWTVTLKGLKVYPDAILTKPNVVVTGANPTHLEIVGWYLDKEYTVGEFINAVLFGGSRYLVFISRSECE